MCNIFCIAFILRSYQQFDSEVIIREFGAPFERKSLSWARDCYQLVGDGIFAV